MRIQMGWAYDHIVPVGGPKIYTFLANVPGFVVSRDACPEMVCFIAIMNASSMISNDDKDGYKGRELEYVSSGEGARKEF